LVNGSVRGHAGEWRECLKKSTEGASACQMSIGRC
jgi:hypothetical protein